MTQIKELTTPADDLERVLHDKGVTQGELKEEIEKSKYLNESGWLKRKP